MSWRRRFSPPWCWADIEDCDTGDGAALALIIAVVVYIALSVAVAFVLLVLNRSQRRAVLTGFLVSLAAALIAFVVAIVYVRSLGTGCPV